MAVTSSPSASSTGRRATPTSSSTCASCPNPHYVHHLRLLTGHDQRVVDYVGREGKLDDFYERLMPLLEFVLPEYVTEGKAHLTVAIGCTGGRHRSVAIAEELAKRFRGREDCAWTSRIATSTRRPRARRAP